MPNVLCRAKTIFLLIIFANFYFPFSAAFYRGINERTPLLSDAAGQPHWNTGEQYYSPAESEGELSAILTLSSSMSEFLSRLGLAIQTFVRVADGQAKVMVRERSKGI